MAGRLDGKVAVITGAASGIGRGDFAYHLFTMGGLEPPTQLPRVRAANNASPTT